MSIEQLVFSLLLALAVSLVVLRFLPRLPFGRRLVLTTELTAHEGFASTPATDRVWLGKGGTVTLGYSTLDQLDMICQRLSGDKF